jgi:hypothetical protein
LVLLGQSFCFGEAVRSQHIFTHPMIVATVDACRRPRYSRPMPDDPLSVRLGRQTFPKAQAQAAEQAFEQRHEAELQAYHLLRELLPYVRDDGTDPELTDLLKEINSVVVEREKANREFTEAALQREGQGRE